VQTSTISWLRSIKYAGRKPDERGAPILSVSAGHSGNIHMRPLTLRIILFILNLKMNKKKQIGMEKFAVDSVSSLRYLCLHLRDTLQFPPVLLHCSPQELCCFVFLFFCFFLYQVSRRKQGITNPGTSSPR